MTEAHRTTEEIMDQAAKDIEAGAEVASAFKQPGLVIDAMASAGGNRPTEDELREQRDSWHKQYCLASEREAALVTENTRYREALEAICVRGRSPIAEKALELNKPEPARKDLQHLDAGPCGARYPYGDPQ